MPPSQGQSLTGIISEGRNIAHMLFGNLCNFRAPSQISPVLSCPFRGHNYSSVRLGFALTAASSLRGTAATLAPRPTTTFQRGASVQSRYINNKTSLKLLGILTRAN